MTNQYVRPAADVSDTGWTRFPATIALPPGQADGDFRRLNELTADDDATYLFSSNNPTGDTVEVKFPRVAVPVKCEDGLLTVRLRSTAVNPPLVTVALLQGTRILAYQNLPPSPPPISTSYIDVNVPVPAAVIATITNFSDLRVRVVAGGVDTGCCPNPIPKILTGTWKLVSGSCPGIDNLQFPLTWIGPGPMWQGSFTLNGTPTQVQIACGNPTFWGMTAIGYVNINSSFLNNPQCSPLALAWTNLQSTGMTCAATLNLTVTP
jgi:hypothetical protein